LRPVIDQPLTKSVMNQNFDDQSSLEGEFRGPSKTRMKKQSDALQDLAVLLTELPKDQLATIPISEDLKEAIDETKNITKREALRRHRQFLGKLMRNSDHVAIAAAVDKIKEDRDRINRMMHVVEHWRDTLIKGEQVEFDRFVELYPDVDRQQLRALVRNAKGEVNCQKPPAQARKLFKFLREALAAVPSEADEANAINAANQLNE
jgi:ribosome-associated protein